MPIFQRNVIPYMRSVVLVDIMCLRFGMPEKQYTYYIITIEQGIISVISPIKFDIRMINDSLFTKPVLIFAGESRPAQDNELLSDFISVLEKLLRNYKGTVICGGTTSGLPGAVGMIANKHRLENTKRYKLYGYAPQHLPKGLQISNDYDVIATTQDTHTFSIAEPLLYWKNIVEKNISAKDVALIGFGGGSISLFEYKLAYITGAVIGLIRNSGRAADVFRAYVEKESEGNSQLIDFTIDALCNVVQKSV